MKLFTQTNKIKAYCNNVIPVENTMWGKSGLITLLRKKCLHDTLITSLTLSPSGGRGLQRRRLYVRPLQ